MRYSRMVTTKKRLIVLALFMTLVFAMSAFSAVFAENSNEKVVRVGWYESPFNTMDKFGRRSGYAYEYQRKIASYSGWKYEYIDGSWPDLLQMLEKGEIDLLSDVSYTKERSEMMFFSDLPMGSEEYYLFALRDNSEINQDDHSTLNGKKIGVNKGSVQIGYMKEWSDIHGIGVEIVELSGSVENTVEMLKNGEIDAYLTLNSFSGHDIIPICKIGSSDFFFAVSKARPDILIELNAAMSRINDEDEFYNERMHEKYSRTSNANFGLTDKESEWLEKHGAIRVGYQDNYLAFCATDSKGELTGALKDYLEYASRCLDTTIKFEPVSYPTSSAAIDAMKNGEVDCVFPANLSDFDCENLGVAISPSLMRTDMYAVVRKSEQKSFVYKNDITVAINQGNPNYEFFLIDNFPGWNTKHFADTSSCLDAVAEGEADCILISNYRFNNISKQCEKLRLTTVSTGVSMDYCFAITEGESELYSILSRITTLVPSHVINASLTYYSAEDAKMTFSDFVNDNFAIFFSVVAVIALLLMLLILRSMRAEKKAMAGQKLIAATETDELTGLYAKNFFIEYANRIYKEFPDKPMDAIVINIDQFHALNALKGRDFGDRALKNIGEAIRSYFYDKDGISARIGSDSFAVYCKHMDNYKPLLIHLEGSLDRLEHNTGIRLRMGVMQRQDKVEPAQQFDRAHMACNIARGNYRGRIIVFDDKMREREIFEQRILNDLRRALAENEFEVYYQPKYDIQADTPKLESAEALVRWNHHELGVISPTDFIPLFEKNGQIEALDKYVWERAVKQISDWRDKYGIVIPVSVNLSRVDIFDPDLESSLDKLIEQYGLERSVLQLEVTESAYIDNTYQVIAVVENLRKKGYVIEMDDFGSGYSSLCMLSSMPIDVLKMDKAFIRNIEHDEKEVQFVKLILDIAKNLKVPVIAEGVETEAQLILLKKLGCALVQGYYFSPPLLPDQFEKLI